MEAKSLPSSNQYWGGENLRLPFLAANVSFRRNREASVPNSMPDHDASLKSLPFERERLRFAS